MDSSSTNSSGIFPCPLRSIHCCPNDEVGSKGIVRMISHIKMHHILNKYRKYVLYGALYSDDDLFMAVEKTLMAFGQWMYGKCMTLHVVSRPCHHTNGLIRFITRADDLTCYIFGILKSYTKESSTNVIRGLVLDVGLLDCLAFFSGFESYPPQLSPCFFSGFENSSLQGDCLTRFC